MAESLVEKVKEMKKTDPEAKEQWYAYCEQYGEDVRDPAKHNAEFMNGFISHYSSGQRLEFQEHAYLAKFIKMGQKKSNAWKNVWTMYCGASPNPKEHDPSKRDHQFLEGFFDFIGNQANNQAAMNFMGGMGAIVGEPPAKRQRVVGQAGPPMSATPAPNDIVMQVKAFQKEGAVQKEAWHNFCDMFCNGIRDPSRHDAASLSKFMSMHGASRPLPTVQGRHMQAPATKASPALRRSAAAQPANANPELINRVKAYQKLGPSEKENWHQFADSVGGVRDPARIDNNTLQQFINDYGA